MGRYKVEILPRNASSATQRGPILLISASLVHYSYQPWNNRFERSIAGRAIIQRICMTPGHGPLLRVSVFYDTDSCCDVD